MGKLKLLTACGLVLAVAPSMVGCSSDETQTTPGTTVTSSGSLSGAGGSGTGGQGGSDASSSGIGGAGGDTTGGGFIPPAPEPELCDHVGMHGAVTIHSIEVLDDLNPPGNTIWTYSPVHIKVKASAADVAPGSTVDVPLQFGIVPPVSAALDVADLSKFICPLEAVILKGLSSEKKEFEFKYVVMEDSCFGAGSPFVDKLTFTPSGDSGWYTVNLAAQIDPFCTDTPEPPILYVDELAGQAPNSDCSSTQGSGCVWDLPVYFPQPGEFDIRLDEVSPASSVGFVSKSPTESTLASSQFGTVQSTIIAYGVPPKLEGPATLPGGNVLLVEFFAKAKGEAGLGDPILVAAGDLDPAQSLSLNQFEMSKPGLFEHRLHLPELTRTKFISGLWSAASTATVTACISFKGQAIDPADCKTFDLALDRAEPSDGLTESSGSDFMPVGTCLNGFGGVLPQWPTSLGSQVRVNANAWAQYYGASDGTHADTGLYVHVSALQNLLSLFLVDASLKADTTTSKQANAVARIEVVGKTIVKQTYQAKLPAANWSKSFVGPCVPAKIPVGPVMVNVEGCPKGTMAFSANGTFSASSGPGPKPFEKATSNGKLALNAVPSGSFGFSGKALAAFGSDWLTSISAGLSGELKLADATFPSNFTLAWGKASSGVVDVNMSGSSTLTLTTLSGVVNAVLKATVLKTEVWSKTLPLWSSYGTTSVPFQFVFPPTTFCVQ